MPGGLIGGGVTLSTDQTITGTKKFANSYVPITSGAEPQQTATFGWNDDIRFNAHEYVLSVSNNGGNVLTLWNTGTSGFSAMTFRAPGAGNLCVGAFGASYGTAAGSTFGDDLYVETCTNIGVANPFAIWETTDNGAGLISVRRVSVVPNGNVTIWQEIRHQDAQIAALSVTPNGTVTCPIAVMGGITLTSGTNTLTLTRGTAAITVPAGISGSIGTAAFGTLGTAASNVVQLDGSAKLPAVDGSALTNLPAGSFSASSVATLTNKTYDTAGTGNVFSINGTAVSAVTGTGSVVLATSPALTTPTLGVEDGLTAHAGGGQASALTLTIAKSYHRISTCATAGDSIKLPASVAGLSRYIRNDGATSAQIFGTSPDTINGVATATGVALAAGAGCWFTCITAGNWTTSPGIVAAQTFPNGYRGAITINGSGAGNTAYISVGSDNQMYFDVPGFAGALMIYSDGAAGNATTGARFGTYSSSLSSTTNMLVLTTSIDLKVSGTRFFDCAVTTASTATFSVNVAMADAKNIVLNATTGTKIGTAASQKIGFWNVTPIIQPAAALQSALTNSTGGTQDGTLVDVATTGIADPTKINSNFTDVYALLDAMRTALVNSGIMKGAA